MEIERLQCDNKMLKKYKNEKSHKNNKLIEKNQDLTY